MNLSVGTTFIFNIVFGNNSTRRKANGQHNPVVGTIVGAGGNPHNRMHTYSIHRIRMHKEIW